MNRSEICSKIEVITISIDMSIDKRSSSLSPLFFSAFSCLFVFVFFFSPFLTLPHFVVSTRLKQAPSHPSHARDNQILFPKLFSNIFTHKRKRGGRQTRKEICSGWLAAVGFIRIDFLLFLLYIYLTSSTHPSRRQQEKNQTRERKSQGQRS